MSIEEYKKELENWKEEHTNFYNECLHAMKITRQPLEPLCIYTIMQCLNSPICLNM